MRCSDPPGGFTETFADGSWYSRWTRHPYGTVLPESDRFAATPGSLSVALSSDAYTPRSAGIEKSIAGTPCNTVRLTFALWVDVRGASDTTFATLALGKPDPNYASTFLRVSSKAGKFALENVVQKNDQAPTTSDAHSTGLDVDTMRWIPVSLEASLTNPAARTATLTIGAVQPLVALPLGPVPLGSAPGALIEVGLTLGAGADAWKVHYDDIVFSGD